MGWWFVVGGWWLVVGGWWLVVGGWWLVVGGWWLVDGGWCRSGWWCREWVVVGVIGPRSSILPNQPLTLGNQYCSIKRTYIEGKGKGEGENEGEGKSDIETVN